MQANSPIGSVEHFLYLSRATLVKASAT